MDGASDTAPAAWFLIGIHEYVGNATMYMCILYTNQLVGDSKLAIFEA